MESTWWEKNKQYVYYLIWAVVGMFGGNVDRVGGFLPDFTNNTLEKRVSELEANQCHCAESPSQVLGGDTGPKNPHAPDWHRDYSK